MKKIILLALLILTTTAHAQFDWAEGLNDFFSDFGRPNCAHEGEIADKPCCSGLQEQYSGYLGETICTEYRETQEITQQPAQQSTENTPIAESIRESQCYDNLYCQYLNGNGWLCDLQRNRCYYSRPSLIDYPIEKISEEKPEKIQTPYSVSEEDVKKLEQSDPYLGTFCTTTKDCSQKIGAGYVCDLEQKQCVKLVGIDGQSYCLNDEDCGSSHTGAWYCDAEINKCFNNYCSNNIQCSEIFGSDYVCNVKKYRCIRATSERSGQYCKKDSDCNKLGSGWLCDLKKSECTLFTGIDEASSCSKDSDCWKSHGYSWSCDSKQKCFQGFNAAKVPETRLEADIVFVPLNFEPQQQKEFENTANLQFSVFKQMAPASCEFSKVVFLDVQDCKEYCSVMPNCLFKAQKCAIEKGYVFAKQIIGVAHHEYVSNSYEYSQVGIANQRNLIATSTDNEIISAYNYLVAKEGERKWYDNILSHELGHNFGLCHVSVSDDSMNKLKCSHPSTSCESTCPNKGDCNIPESEKVNDVMTYCWLESSKFGPAAYRHIDTQCRTPQSSNQQQAFSDDSKKLLAAYITISRDGTAEVNSLHVGYGTPDEEQGNYVLEAYDDGREITSEDFTAQFLLHSDRVDKEGKIHSELVELNEVSAVVKIPYSPEIDEIKIEHNGQVLVARELSEIAADGNMFAQTDEGNAQITALPEDIAEKQGITITNVVYEQNEGNLIYNVEGKKTELFLGFIPIDEHVTATYDNNGNLLNYHQKPWWQFWG